LTEVDGSITNEIELPTGGNNGQILSTDGSGSYSWVDDIDTDTDTQLSQEEVQDHTAAMLVGGTDITASYNDSANTFTFDYTGTGGGVDGVLTGITETANSSLGINRLWTFARSNGLADINFTYKDLTSFNTFTQTGGVTNFIPAVSNQSLVEFVLGVSNPAYLLDVNGDARLKTIVDGNGSTGTSGQVLKSTATGIDWANDDTGPWFSIPFSGSTSIFPVASTPRVGIGTTSPQETLDIDGTIRFRGQLKDENNSTGTSGQVLSTTSTGTDWITISSNTDIDFGTLQYDSGSPSSLGTSSSTWSKFNFAITGSGGNNNISSSSSTDDFTINTTGYYEVTANITLDGAVGSGLEIAIFEDSTPEQISYSYCNTAANNTFIMTNLTFHNAGDKVSLRYRQRTDDTGTVTHMTADSNLAIKRLD